MFVLAIALDFNYAIIVVTLFTFNERVVGRQTFLHEAAVWLDDFLKKHHIRRVSMWRYIKERDRTIQTAVSKVKHEPSHPIVTM